MIPTVDMTQDSSTIKSSSNPTQSSEKLSGGTLLEQINTQLELLSQICDTGRVSPIIEEYGESKEDSCYVISSDSDDDIEKVRPVKSIEEAKLEDVLPEVQVGSNDNDDLEDTVIYYGQDRSLVNKMDEEGKFVESLVDQTIIDEESSDSIDFKELNETLETFPSLERPEKLEIPAVFPSEQVEPGRFNDSFDEFDALVYGEQKVPSPVPVTVSSEIPQDFPSFRTQSRSPLPQKPSTLEQDFARLASLDRKFAKKQEFKIKTRDVTPPPNYERMDETKLEWEMKRFGLKYIKRREHQIQMLNHIYARTHPFI